MIELELYALAAKIVARRKHLGRHWFFWNRLCIAFAHPQHGPQSAFAHPRW